MLDEWNERRRKIAKWYLEQLSKIDNIQLPATSVDESVWHQFVIRINNRNEFQKKLNDLGIPTMIHYPVPPHLSEAYAALGFKKGDFPVSESLANTFLSLPIGPHMSPADAERVTDAVRKVLLTF